MSKQRSVLLKDPHLPWNGVFPYEYLTALLGAHGLSGVGPESTARAVKDVYFDLMAGSASDRSARLSWDALRDIGGRLVIDFFLYEVPEPDVDGLIAELAAREVPVTMPDFRGLAMVPLDLSVLSTPARVDETAAPGSPPVRAEELTPVTVDLAPEPVDLVRLLEGR